MPLVNFYSDFIQERHLYICAKEKNLKQELNKTEESLYRNSYFIENCSNFDPTWFYLWIWSQNKCGLRWKRIHAVFYEGLSVLFEAQLMLSNTICAGINAQEGCSVFGKRPIWKCMYHPRKRMYWLHNFSNIRNLPGSICEHV